MSIETQGVVINGDIEQQTISREESMSSVKRTNGDQQQATQTVQAEGKTQGLEAVRQTQMAREIEKARQAEQARQAEDAEKAEQARHAEEAKQAKQAEQAQQQADQQRQAESGRLSELQRLRERLQEHERSDKAGSNGTAAPEEAEQEHPVQTDKPGQSAPKPGDPQQLEDSDVEESTGLAGGIKGAARKTDEALKRVLSADAPTLAKWDSNLGGTSEITARWGVGSATGVWENSGINAKTGMAGFDISVWNRLYRLRANPNLSVRYGNDYGTAPTGSVGVISKAGAKVAYLAPIGTRTLDNGAELYQGAFFGGVGLSVPKWLGPIEKAINGFTGNKVLANFDIPPLSTEALLTGGQGFINTSFTKWLGGATNIVRTEDADGNMIVTEFEILGYLGIFLQSTINGYAGVGGKQIPGEAMPPKLEAGMAFGVYHADAITFGGRFTYERQHDTRNGGDIEKTAVMNEGNKLTHGPDGLLSLIYNEASSGAESKTYGDPVREQLLTAIHEAGLDPAASRLTFDELRERVNAAIADGADAERFAGAGGLDFSVSANEQQDMFINEELRDQFIGATRIGERTKLSNDENGNLMVSTRVGNEIHTRFADDRMQGPGQVKKLNFIEMTGIRLRDGYAAVNQGVLTAVANTIQGSAFVVDKGNPAAGIVDKIITDDSAGSTETDGEDGGNGTVDDAITGSTESNGENQETEGEAVEQT